MSYSQKTTLQILFDTIQARKNEADPLASYTASLLAKGPVKCAEKFGEEAIETISAAVRVERTELVLESADMLFHWLTMLVACDVTLEAVMTELARRTGTSGHVEKENRKN